MKGEDLVVGQLRLPGVHLSVFAPFRQEAVLPFDDPAIEHDGCQGEDYKQMRALHPRPASRIYAWPLTSWNVGLSCVVLPGLRLTLKQPGCKVSMHSYQRNQHFWQKLNAREMCRGGSFR